MHAWSQLRYGSINFHVVTQTSKSYLPNFRSFCWAALWSAVLTAFIVSAIEASSKCFLVVHDVIQVWAIAALIWLWILLFLFFDSNRSRLILTGCTVLAFMAVPHVDSLPGLAGEVAALSRLRELAQGVESYRKEHPLAGFPSNLPNTSTSRYAAETEKLYKMDFTTSRSKPDGPTDGFLIQATPVWRECGYLRSFAASDDGHIHFTIEMRPATKADPILPE